MNEKDICEICNKPILPGQPVHGMTRNHYDCEPKRGLTRWELDKKRIDDTIRRMDAALERAKVESERARIHRPTINGPKRLL